MAGENADVRTVRKLIALENRRREIEDELKGVKKQIEDLTPGVLAYFQRQGIDRFTSDGRTAYLQREVWASKAEEIDTVSACLALEQAGLGEFAAARVNSQGLTAHVRELEADHPDKALVDLLPPALRGVVKISEVFKVKTRRAS